jgi:hypothetical protein
VTGEVLQECPLQGKFKCVVAGGHAMIRIKFKTDYESIQD